MEVKFKLEIYDAENTDNTIGIYTGTSYEEDNNEMMDYLLRLKEQRYNEQAN